MLSKNPEALVFVVDFVVHDGSLQLGLFATWAWNKKKSYGDNGFGNLYRLYITIHEGSALTEDQRGTGLLCFSAFFFLFDIYIFFCILGQRGLESSHLRFLSSTAFGRGQGGYVSRASRGFLYFYLLTGNILPRPCFFFYSFLSFFHHPLTFAFVLFCFRCFLLIYTTFSAKQQKRAGWKFETQKNTCGDGEYGLSLKLLKQAAETSWKGTLKRGRRTIRTE